MKIDPPSSFPVYACPYSQRLAALSPRFARQVYPQRSRLSAPPSIDGQAQLGQYSIDPFGELTHASKVKGLKQRFPDRVLIMTTEHCFMNCRHCTRQGLFGKTEIVETAADLKACLRYVKSHPLVRDVLLSGGDILTLPDAQVLKFVDAFAALEQIDIVRVCTRAPCTNPPRITKRLAKALGRSKKVWVNTQFNCADEVTPAARKAAALLVEAGIPVSCQSVLLKGVNDTPEEMLKLLQALSAARIRPYYVFMCDPILGIDHFRVSRRRAKAIEKYCAESIGGLALPRFVMDVPGAKRKLPI